MKQQGGHAGVTRRRVRSLIGACGVVGALTTSVIVAPPGLAVMNRAADAPIVGAADVHGTTTEGVGTASSLGVPGAYRNAPRRGLRGGAAFEARQAGAVSAAASAPAEGSFVSYNHRIFRIVGGAPLYVSSWTPFGGTKPVRAITESQYLATSQYPRDGTFVRAMPGASFFRFVAGAPIYVSTWTAFGGRQTATDIDANDIARAGGVFPWDGVWNMTLDWDGSDGGPAVFVKGGQTGRVYKMVGGAPVYVRSWTPYGGRKSTVTIDQNAIDRAGGTNSYRFVRKHPLDGWLIRARQSGRTFVVAGGASIYVSNTNLITGVTPSPMDQVLIERTDNTAPWDNLLFRPVNHTYVKAIQNGAVYQVTWGVPHHVLHWSDVGGVQPNTAIDKTAIDNAGKTGVWAHLLAVGSDVPSS